MSIGLVAALPVEIRCLTRQSAKINFPFRINPSLIGIVSGIGASNTERAAELLLDEKIDGLVSWGTAAGLMDHIHSGDLLLPERVVDKNGAVYPIDRNWSARIADHLASTSIRIHNGILVETDMVLGSPEQKAALAANTGAIAADMETAAIARIAHNNGLSCIAIRTIVDESRHVLPPEVIRHTDNYGKPDVMRLAHEIFLKPGLIPQLYHLGQAMRRATTTLASIGRQMEGSLQQRPDTGAG